MTQPLVLHAAEETLEAVHTRRHAAYPAYDPSGVEWLGDVPEHWVVKRLKRSVLSRKGGVWGEEPDDENMGVICVRVADFNRKSLRVRIENPTLRSISAGV
jgi:type I restriction enzyme S subunit